MLKIKLKQIGKKHQRTYRIVVAEAKSKVNGSFVEEIGFYTPQTKKLEVNQEKLAGWVKNGAQITLGVDKLLNPDKHPRVKKVKETETPVAEAPAASETPTTPETQ